MRSPVASCFRDRGRKKDFGQLHPQERALSQVPTDGQKGLPYPPMGKEGRARTDWLFPRVGREDQRWEERGTKASIGKELKRTLLEERQWLMCSAFPNKENLYRLATATKELNPPSARAQAPSFEACLAKLLCVLSECSTLARLRSNHPPDLLCHCRYTYNSQYTVPAFTRASNIRTVVVPGDTPASTPTSAAILSRDAILKGCFHPDSPAWPYCGVSRCALARSKGFSAGLWCWSRANAAGMNQAVSQHLHSSSKPAESPFEIHHQEPNLSLLSPYYLRYPCVLLSWKGRLLRQRSHSLPFQNWNQRWPVSKMTSSTKTTGNTFSHGIESPKSGYDNIIRIHNESSSYPAIAAASVSTRAVQSPPHRNLLNRILEEAQVAEDTTPEGLEQIIAALMNRGDNVRMETLVMAAKLSQGITLSLAPAALANIYWVFPPSPCPRILPLLQ
ncbi:hypothetical protein Acr_05g0004250 [Actinidia rufa]|uniref:Uncharacterized protein n=1 Tax=Actinidia rufa TaxID=165716 RepID=A0A7J0EKP8_9ERIC|nr:hypothetical protein Acr_05g0004250 [Actinidia rufa]